MVKIKKWLRLFGEVCSEKFGIERSAMDLWDVFVDAASESRDAVPLISEKWMQDDMQFRMQEKNVELTAYIQKLHLYINEIETREKNLLQSLLSVPVTVWVTLQRPDTCDVDGFLSVHRSEKNGDFVLTLKPVEAWSQPSISITLADACFAWCMQNLRSHDKRFRSLLWFRLDCGTCFTLAFHMDVDRAKFDTMFRNA